VPTVANVACFGYELPVLAGEFRMTTPVHELEAEVLSLAAPDRARILERLIESFDRDSKVDEAWLDEALRREKEVASGQAAMVPGRDAVARIRARLP
jgi:Putative addiction module component